MEPYIGQIETFAFGFAPKGWASCNGQMLMISQNPSLFSLIGSVYGGDGIQTFALPDLRGRVPINQGHTPGLTKRVLGSKGGEEESSVQILQNEDEMRVHVQKEVAHKVTTLENGRKNGEPDNTVGLLSYENIMQAVLQEDEAPPEYEKINNMSPYLTINYCIAVEGVFPSRSC